jgi:hypothetical protein
MVLALAAAPAVSCAAQITVVPVHRAPATAPAGRFHPRPFGPHKIYGEIVAIRGSQLIVRRRNGHLQTVDDTIAIADNAYSMPLFVGKYVVIDGTMAKGVFGALHIYRLTDLQGLSNDT